MIAERLPLLPIRYQLHDQLSAGQSALVFKVWDTNNQQYVLAKIFSNDHQRAYRREAAAALALKHDNVVSCLDTFYLETGEACLIYEFLKDGSLSDFIKNNLLDKSTILDILEDVLLGLTCLHKHGFVHCDLKPDNILIRIDPYHHKVHAILADLGSATPIKEARSGRQSIGSPAYTAPERLYEGFSTSSDLYSLGVIAFQLSTGHLPFIGDVQEVYRAHLSRQPALNEIQDKELQELIALLLEKDVSQRIHSAEEAIHIIQRLSTPQTHTEYLEPINNYPLETVYPLHKLNNLSIKQIHKWSVNQLPISFIFSGKNTCLGIAYHDYIQFFNLYGQTISPILLSHGPYFYTDNHGILYPDSHHFVKYYPETGKREELSIPCKKALAFACNSTHLIWLDHHQVYIYHLSGQLCTTFSKKHYTLEPFLRSHPKGGFLISDGIANQKLVWLSEDGKEINTWQLCGPILALTISNKGILVACAALGQQEKLAFYLLKDDTEHQIQENMCLGSVITVDGHICWLRKDHHIMIMNQDFIPYSIGILPDNQHLMALSPNLSYLASLSISINDTYECQLWQIQQLQEAYHG